MSSSLLQGWTTVRGTAGTVLSIPQGVEGWVDVGDAVDATFWVDCREALNPTGGSVTLSLETSPTKDQSSFVPITAPITLTPSPTPITVRTVASQATAPLARWLRWRLSVPTGSTGAWDATFRIAMTGTPFSYFLPTQLAGCQLWLRADLGVTLATGVSAWNDQSNAGDSNRNATQASGAAQPVYTPTDANFNKQPTVSTTSGVNMFMSTGTWSAALAQPFTAFLVWRDTSGSSWAFDNISAGEVGVEQNGGSTKLFAGSVAGSGATSRNVSNVVVAVFNGSNSSLYVSQNTGATGLSPGTNFPTGLVIGNANGGGASFSGASIAELAMFSRILSAAEVSRLNAYGGSRYGIAIGP